MFCVRQATLEDVAVISEIEAICFPAAEAASYKSFKERMQVFLECFLVLESEGKVVGAINGMVVNENKITDILFEDASLHCPDGKWQSVFGLIVLPEYQRRGGAGMLLKAFEVKAREDARVGCILTCKERLISYYGKYGYENIGVSQSVHGGAIWYDMVLEF
ncbi:MAG: GNAT family N-acetyltransferase [Lachnospiraceae bacterium]